MTVQPTPPAEGGGIMSLAASRLLFASSGFLVHMVLARGLEREAFGVVKWISAVVAIATFGSNLGLATWILREVARLPSRTRALVPPALRATAALSAITGVALVGYITLRDPRPMITLCAVLAAITLWMQAAAQITESALHGLHRTRSEVPAVLSGRAVLVLGTLWLVWLGYGVTSVFVVRVASGAISLVLLHRALQAHAPPADPADVEPGFGDLIRTGRTFGATVLFGAIYAQVDVLLLEAMRGDDEVARYTAPAGALLQLGLASNVISRSFYPRVAAADPARVPGLIQLQTRMLLSASVPVAAGGAVVGAALVPAIFGDRYVDAVLPFQILVAVVPLRFLNNGYGLSLAALDAQHTRARIDGAAALFNVVANVIVLPRWGAVGAAATTLATDLLLLAALRVALGRRQSGLGELGLVLHAAALGAVLYLAVSFVPGGWIMQVVAGIALWPLLVVGTGLLQRSHLAAARRL